MTLPDRHGPLRIFLAGLVVGLALAPGAANAAAPEADWNVVDTGQPYRDIRVATTQGTWMSIDVSADGRTIVFDLLGDIYSIPASGGEATLLHGGAAMQRTPRFSRDGRQLLYVSDAAGAESVWISAVDGSAAREATHGGCDVMMAAGWGPDDDSVVAGCIDGDYPSRFASEVRLFDLAGGRRVLVPTPANRRDVAEPVVSRDGRFVYYTERLTSPDIYVDANHINYAVKRRELATAEVREFASGWGGAFAPQVSPDGRRVAFVRRVKDKTLLFDLDVATGAQRAVYDGLDRDLQASYEAQVNYYPSYGWFPDNRHVAIWARGGIYKIDMDTGVAVQVPFEATATHRILEPLRFEHELAPAKVTVRAVRDLAPSPDGRSLVFTALGRLWRKALPQGTPEPFDRSTAAQFEPAYSADGRSIVYVEWDDVQGSALKVATANGGRARTLASSGGVIRQPQFSADGSRVVYRIQAPDTSMGGARARPGIYWVAAQGGESHYVTAGDDAPYFSPDGSRVFYVEVDRSGASPSHVLKSATVDGYDVREHARAPDADTMELRLSPDQRWLAFRENQQYYLVAYVETGTPLIVAAGSAELPVRRLTDVGGFALAWSRDARTLHWALGPQLYRANVQGSAGARPEAHASIGLEVATDEPGGSVAFTNARIVTMRADEVIEHGTLVISGNRITAVGPAQAVTVPRGARIIDATGKTILPGLVDAHGHIECCYRTGAVPQKQGALYAALAFGVTTNFDPYPNELTSYELTERALAGLAVSPRWIGTGSAVWGRSQQASNLYVPIDSLDDARAAIARKKALGGIIVKSYRYPERRKRQMLVKAGREAGVMVDVEGESQFYNNLTMVLDGHTNLEHNLPLATYYDDIVQLFSRARVHNTPTLVVNFGELFGENYLYQTTQAWKEPKVRTYVQEVLSGYSPLGTPYGAPPYARAMTSIQAADEIWDVGFRAVSRSTKALADAGVVINVGSHGEVPGLAMHWEMWLLAQGGMGNADILRAATMNGARTLGLDQQIGSLEPGKMADLIVLDGNPLADIRATNTVRYTMLNGRLYDSLTMDEIGNHPRPRTRFYWETEDYNGIDWNASWTQ